MVRNSQRAYSPRSAKTMTVMVAGMVRCRCWSRRNHSAFQAPGAGAGKTAPGIAQPRSSTLIAKTTNRSPKVVASSAWASWGPCHHRNTQRSKGAKQASTARV